jgi:hypothetical protein
MPRAVILFATVLTASIVPARTLKLQLSCRRDHATRLIAGAVLGPWLPPAWAADIDAAKRTRDLLKEARAQLEPCAALIADGQWDGVRTAVKTAPLANAKNLITRYIGEAGEKAEDLVVPREDLVQALQLLDMAVYNNVFTSEQNGQGARGKGVQIDRDTPLRHLGESKAALDEIIGLEL